MSEAPHELLEDKYPSLFDHDQFIYPVAVGPGWIPLVDTLCRLLVKSTEQGASEVKALQVKEKSRSYASTRWLAQVITEGSSNWQRHIPPVFAMFAGDWEVWFVLMAITLPDANLMADRHETTSTALQTQGFNR